MGRGNPRELAKWAHETLDRRKCGKPYALILDGDTATLVDSDTDKIKLIETVRPHAIVGHYHGYHKRPPRVTVEDFEADIRMTLEGV